MLRISPTPTSARQKLMNLVDEFVGSDCGENEVRKTFALTKGPTGVDYLSSNHVSHTVSDFVSNFAKNVSNYLTLDAGSAFDQLCNAVVTKPAITKLLVTWSINCNLRYNLSVLSYAHTLYWISTSFLEERSSMYLRNISLLGDYLQINAFLIPVLVEREL